MGTTIIGPSPISKLLVFIFRISGLWYYPDTTVAYKLYAFLLHFVFSFLYTICFVVNVFFLTDVSDATDSLCITLTVVALLVKVFNFFWYNTLIQRNLEKIQQFQLIDDNEIRLVNSRTKMFSKLMVYYYCICNTTGITTFINAIFVTPPKLPFPGWYPMDWQHNNRDYWLTYFYQTLGMAMEINWNITIELFPCYVMFMISVKMELLGGRMANIKPMKIEMMGDDGRTLMANRQVMDEWDEEANQKSVRMIADCIKVHQDIMR